MKLMVFDVGGTEIKYSVMGEDLVPRCSGSVPTPREKLEEFLQTLRNLYQPHAVEAEGIAMSLPGVIDVARGVVTGGGALEYNWGQDVGPQLAKMCGCEVRMANDGKCAALAELSSGALAGCRSGSVFLIGTGVGGGLVIDGKVVQGSHGTAGEYSFVLTDPDHWKSPQDMMGGICSTRGLLDRYRSAKGLPEDEPLDGKRFFARFHAGEREARETLAEFAHLTAIQIFNLTVLLDLEKVAIGGGISRQTVLIDAIRTALEEVFADGPASAFHAPFTIPEVVPCRYGSEANQVGAYIAYRDKTFF